jgi:hypothetical protein
MSLRRLFFGPLVGFLIAFGILIRNPHLDSVRTIEILELTACGFWAGATLALLIASRLSRQVP